MTIAPRPADGPLIEGQTILGKVGPSGFTSTRCNTARRWRGASSNRYRVSVRLRRGKPGEPRGLASSRAPVTLQFAAIRRQPMRLSSELLWAGRSGLRCLLPPSWQVEKDEAPRGKLLGECLSGVRRKSATAESSSGWSGPDRLDGGLGERNSHARCAVSAAIRHVWSRSV